MSRIGLLATVCGVAAFALASAVNATPLGAPAKGLSAAETGVVDLVHGCHREWARDRYGLHRHGRECRRIEAEEREPYYEPPRVYEPRCYYLGPVRVCE
jgi:hypothetical protein